uniref:Uncharacterized protein n=1 Tax=Anguilla anguilla TaxID=7936 RepID=A0A0E9WJB0_ANGAN
MSSSGVSFSSVVSGTPLHCFPFPFRDLGCRVLALGMFLDIMPCSLVLNPDSWVTLGTTAAVTSRVLVDIDS